MGVIIAYWLLGSLVGVPIEWIFAGFSIGAGFTYVVLRRQLLVRFAGFTLAAIFLRVWSDRFAVAESERSTNHPVRLGGHLYKGFQVEAVS